MITGTLPNGRVVYRYIRVGSGSRSFIDSPTGGGNRAASASNPGSSPALWNIRPVVARRADSNLCSVLRYRKLNERMPWFMDDCSLSTLYLIFEGL